MRITILASVNQLTKKTFSIMIILRNAGTFIKIFLGLF